MSRERDERQVALEILQSSTPRPPWLRSFARRAPRRPSAWRRLFTWIKGAFR